MTFKTKFPFLFLHFLQTQPESLYLLCSRKGTSEALGIKCCNDNHDDDAADDDDGVDDDDDDDDGDSDDGAARGDVRQVRQSNVALTSSAGQPEFGKLYLDRSFW